MFQLYLYPFEKVELQKLPKTKRQAAKHQHNPTAYNNSPITDENNPQNSHNKNVTDPYVHATRHPRPSKRIAEESPTNVIPKKKCIDRIIIAAILILSK